MAKGPPPTPKITNKKATFNFELLEKIEAGIELMGSEVKSLRAGKASLDEAYAFIENGQVSLRDCNISPYPMAGYVQHKPTRPRRLLMHRREIRKWEAKVTTRGLTLIPLSIYFNERGLAKVLLALARGKTHGDKRQSIRERDAKREITRAMRRR